MRLRRTIFASMLMILFACTPAFASVSFEVNGSQFKPATDYTLREGVTFIEANILDTIIGADVSINGQNIIIVNNNDKLELTVSQTDALFNGQNISLAAAPYVNGPTTMLPLRTVGEALGLTIGWNEANSTVFIDYEEKRNNMSAEELLVKSSLLLNELPTYDMDGSAQMQMKMSGIEEEGFPLNVTMDTELYAHYQNEPLAVYIKQVINMGDVPGLPPEAANMEVESMLTDNNYYMNMPGQGWIKMDLGAFNLDELMQTYNNQDPSVMLKQMQDFGMISTFGNDVTIDGQTYWVVSVIMDKGKFMEEIQKLLAGLPLAGEQELMDAMANLDFDMTYINFINAATLMTDYMDMDLTMKMSIPSPEENSTEVLDMNISMKGRFSIKETSADFEFPDVSSAINMTDLVNSI